MISFLQSQFPIRITPQEDEIFSSWLTRLALAHGLPGNQLAKYFTEKKGLFATTRDVDRLFDQSLFERLSEKTGIAVEHILSATLSSYTGYLFSEFSNKTGQLPWILPFGSPISKKKNHVIQFCQQCLKEDDKPYFRKKWRLSFVVNCTKHKIILSDRCSNCSTPINYFWSFENKILPIYICKQCNFDLREAVIEKQDFPLSSFEVEFQKHLEEVLNKGWVENQIGSTYSHLYFSGIYLIMLSLCGKRRRRFCEAVSKFYRIENIPIELLNPINIVEFRSLKERRFLNILVAHLLANWHHDFVKICKDIKFHFKELVPQTTKEYPFWYWKVISEHLTHPNHTCSDLEIDSLYRYVKSHVKLVSAKEFQEQFGLRYYVELVRKRKLISFKKSEPRKCIYCKDTENQKRASKLNPLIVRYYCGICRRNYSPKPLPRKKRHPIETQKIAEKLIKEGICDSKIALMLSLNRVTISTWRRKLCVYCRSNQTQHNNNLSSG